MSEQEVSVRTPKGFRCAVASLPPQLRSVSRSTAWRWRRDRHLSPAECPAGEWVRVRIGRAKVWRWIPVAFVQGLMREQLGLFR